MSEVENKVKAVIGKQLGRKPDQIELTHHLVHDLEADSIDFMELVMSFEDEFGITINLDNREKRAPFATVADAVAFVEARLNQ